MTITPYEVGQIIAGFTNAERQNPPVSASAYQEAVYRVVNLILQGQTDMSASITALDAKISELTTTVNTKLTAAQTARDKAVADLATTNATLADVQAKLAAMPNDTADLEAQIEAETAKVSAVIDGLNAVDTSPVAAPAPTAPVVDPAPVTPPTNAPPAVTPPAEPTADAPPVDPTTQPVQVAPADINPAVPPATLGTT